MNPTTAYLFTIIVPVYNEEDNIYTLVQRLDEYLPKALRKACVLLVNDGSKDSSQKRIEEACAVRPDFFYLDLEKNTGLSGAIKAGIDHANSKYVGYMDADLQTTPEDFNLLLEHVDNYEMVMGIRANRKDTFFKKFQSKIANGFRRMMTNDGVEDTGCPLKVIHTDYPPCTLLYRYAPFPAGTDLAAGRTGEAGTRAPFSPNSRFVQVPPVEPAGFAFPRLLRLSLDEEKIHQLSGWRY